MPELVTQPTVRSTANNIDRAASILLELRRIERECQRNPELLTDWQTDEHAVQYRRLLRDWWAIDSASAMHALYHTSTGKSFRNRLLTSKTDQRVYRSQERWHTHARRGDREWLTENTLTAAAFAWARRVADRIERSLHREQSA